MGKEETATINALMTLDKYFKSCFKKKKETQRKPTVPSPAAESYDTSALVVALSHDRHFLTGSWCTGKDCLAVLFPPRLLPWQIPHGKNNRPVKTTDRYPLEACFFFL